MHLLTLHFFQRASEERSARETPARPRGSDVSENVAAPEAGQADDGDSNEISGYVLFPPPPPPSCPRDVENGSPRHSRTGGRAARRGAVRVMTNRANSKMDLTCETGMSQVTPALTKARAQPPSRASQKTQLQGTSLGASFGNARVRSRKKGSARAQRARRFLSPCFSLLYPPQVFTSREHRGGRATVAPVTFFISRREKYALGVPA